MRIPKFFGQSKARPPEPDVPNYYYGIIRTPKKLQDASETAGMNYPPAHANAHPVWIPKGLAAPIPATRPDMVLDQRLTERMDAFGSRLPMQYALRQEKQVIAGPPVQTTAIRLTSPSRTQTWPADRNAMYPGFSQGAGGVGSWSGPGDQVGAISPGGSSGGGAGGGSGRYPMSATEYGMYRTDHTLMTQMGQTHIAAAAPVLTQNIQGYVDVQTQVILNGQYSTVNTDLATLYMNLRAPRPFEDIQNNT